MAQLLPYEDSATQRPSDAQHWFAIYRELVALHEEHLARVAAADAACARRRLAWLRDRYAFWLQRSVTLAGLVYQASTRRLQRGELGVVLTRREAELFQVFLDHPGRHFSAQQLVNRAWHGDQLSPEQLRVYVARLRRRLEELGTPCRLEHHPGHGYSFVLLEPNGGGPGG